MPTAAASANSSWRSWAPRDSVPKAVPRIGVPIAAAPEYADAVRETGGEPVALPLLEAYPEGGVALAREWVADVAQILAANLDALLLDAELPEGLAGLLLAALRLGLPAVHPASETPLSVALAALGLAPLARDPATVVVGLAREGRPRPRSLVESFSLANALRAGLSAGGGPELLVHLSAVARETGVAGFPRMGRVLAPETPGVAGPGWIREHGVSALLSRLGDTLHDVPTVEGRLKMSLPSPPTPEGRTGSRLVFVRGRVSGTEVVCRAPRDAPDAGGECRVFASEEAAVRAVLAGKLDASSFLVVAGCGPRGGPGISRLDRLGEAMREASSEGVPVLTDGLAPDGPPGLRFSLAAPEAAVGGIIGRLRDGDALRIDLEGGRIRTGIGAEELGRREPFGYELSTAGYAARYARSALPALEGGGFG